MSDQFPEAPPVVAQDLAEVDESATGGDSRVWPRFIGLGLVAALLGLAIGWLIADDSQEVESLRTELAGRDDTIDEIENDLSETEGDLEETSADLDATSTELDDTTEQLEASQEEIEALRLEYDPQIRAQAEQQHATALAVACEESIADGSPDYSAMAREYWAASWGDLIALSRDTFEGQVEGCAAPELAKSFRERCGGSPDVEAMQKDPDSFTGQCFVFVVDVVQFDQATGPCSFRGSWDSQPREYSFDYRGDNAFLDAEEPCPFLDAVGQDDVVRVWATVLGGIDYETTIGGQAHAVGFDVGDAELVVDN